MGMRAFVTRLIAFVRNPISDVAWSSADEAQMSPAERAFVEDAVSGHDADALVGGTFGGGDPRRLLDFPGDGPPR